MLSRVLRTSALAVAVATATLPAVAHAQAPFKATITVSNYFYLVTVNSVNGFVAPGSINPTGPGLTFMIDRFFCTDDKNVITIPSTFDAWVTPLWPANQDMSRTRLGAQSVANAQALYQGNANYADGMTGQNAQSQTRQANMWSVMNNPGGGGGPVIANPFGWFVISDYDNFNTNARFGGLQELLAVGTDANIVTNSVPEPGTYALLIPGLAIVFGVARRRRSVTLA